MSKFHPTQEPHSAQPPPPTPLLSCLVEEVDALGEEKVRVDKHHVDLVQQARLRDSIQDDAVTGDERRGEDGVLLPLSTTLKSP